MSALLKFGVLGLGRMGQLYARFLATQVAGVSLYAVADVDETLRSATAEAFNLAHAFAEPEELLALTELDAVVIATPTSTHTPLVVAAARTGKAIFCEKPLALTVEETLQAMDAVAQVQVPLQMGFMRRFDAATKKPGS